MTTARTSLIVAAALSVASLVLLLAGCAGETPIEDLPPPPQEPAVGSDLAGAGASTDAGGRSNPWRDDRTPDDNPWAEPDDDAGAEPADPDSPAADPQAALGPVVTASGMSTDGTTEAHAAATDNLRLRVDVAIRRYLLATIDRMEDVPGAERARLRRAAFVDTPGNRLPADSVRRHGAPMRGRTTAGGELVIVEVACPSAAVVDVTLDALARLLPDAPAPDRTIVASGLARHLHPRRDP
jgi:hypothetical protein